MLPGFTRSRTTCNAFSVSSMLRTIEGTRLRRGDGGADFSRVFRLGVGFDLDDVRFPFARAFFFIGPAPLI